MKIEAQLKNVFQIEENQNTTQNVLNTDFLTFLFLFLNLKQNSPESLSQNENGAENPLKQLRINNPLGQPVVKQNQSLKNTLLNFIKNQTPEVEEIFLPSETYEQSEKTDTNKEEENLRLQSISGNEGTPIWFQIFFLKDSIKEEETNSSFIERQQINSNVSKIANKTSDISAYNLKQTLFENGNDIVQRSKKITKEEGYLINNRDVKSFFQKDFKKANKKDYLGEIFTFEKKQGLENIYKREVLDNKNFFITSHHQLKNSQKTQIFNQRTTSPKDRKISKENSDINTSMLFQGEADQGKAEVGRESRLSVSNKVQEGKFFVKEDLEENKLKSSFRVDRRKIQEKSYLIDKILSQTFFDHKEISAERVFHNSHQNFSTLHVEKVPIFIKEMVVKLHPQGWHEAHLKLHPPELGELHLSVSVDRGEVKLLLTVEHPRTAEALHQHLGQLETAFESLGLQFGGAEINLASGGGNYPGEQFAFSSTVQIEANKKEDDEENRRIRQSNSLIDIRI